MKVIDLLNKIANNEEVPKEIKWFDKWKNEEFTYIFDEEYKDYERIDFCEYLFNDHFMTTSLNDEIEIIEEKSKKIEKIQIDNGHIIVGKTGYILKGAEMILANKINNIIDYLLEKESDK